MSTLGDPDLWDLHQRDNRKALEALIAGSDARLEARRKALAERAKYPCSYRGCKARCLGTYGSLPEDWGFYWEGGEAMFRGLKRAVLCPEHTQWIKDHPIRGRFTNDCP
jgi:hypothetical protein